jgi:t-SNARE complex subunit (syntaxin)
MQSNRSGQARAVLSEVQSRHDDIKKIEKTILVNKEKRDRVEDSKSNMDIFRNYINCL